MSEKYYCELSSNEEALYCTADLPVKEEGLPEAIGLPDYKARQIIKEEYEKETEQDET